MNEAEELRTGIRALVRRFSISERADVSCCGMTVAQAATLGALAAEGPMRLGALGRQLGISPSTLTRNLQRLEERGLVERIDDPQDARASLARLTRGGRKAARDVEQREIRFAETILQQLPTGLRPDALATLKELLQATRRATEACCPGAFDHLMEG